MKKVKLMIQEQMTHLHTESKTDRYMLSERLSRSMSDNEELEVIVLQAMRHHLLQHRGDHIAAMLTDWKSIKDAKRD